MRKILLIGGGMAVAALLTLGGVFYYRNLRGIGPAIFTPSEKIGDILPDSNRGAAGNPVDMPLSLPPGFKISIFARDIPGARVMAKDALGNIWVSRTSEGKITLLEVKDGAVIHKTDIFRNLMRPHGLAFDPQDPFVLYFAEEDKISRVRAYSESEPEKIADLPAGGGHYTRTLLFGPDGRLYVSIGSSCNACSERDPRRAKIFSMRKDGSDFKEFARGLRNAVFMAIHPLTGKIWVTEMGRDMIGDDIPPDEINILEEGGNYGWPICYGKNIHDTDFDKNTYIRNPCLEPFEIPSRIDIPAHSAPLGLAFVPEEAWPEEYWHDLIVAYHGSWNRSVPTGYKLVRMRLDSQGRLEGMEDFVSGWLVKKGSGYEALGRPVDVFIQPGGVMLVTDDKAGLIYKISAPGIR